jgi:hypothetical protein
MNWQRFCSCGGEIFSLPLLYSSRYVSLSGTPKELKAALNAYGIPGVLLPISDDGEVINEHDNLIWTKRRLEERQNKRSINNLGHTADTPFSQNHEQLQDDQVAPLESFEFFTSAIPDTEHSMDGSLSSSSHPFCDSVEATTTPDCTRAETSSPFAISTPGNNDVLLGRGRLGQWHMVCMVYFLGFVELHPVARYSFLILTGRSPPFFLFTRCSNMINFRETFNFETSLRVSNPNMMVLPKSKRLPWQLNSCAWYNPATVNS